MSLSSCEISLLPVVRELSHSWSVGGRVSCSGHHYQLCRQPDDMFDTEEDSRAYRKKGQVQQVSS